MDFTVLLADLRDVAEKYKGKSTEPQVSTLAYVEMFTKVLRGAQKACTDVYNDQITVLWVALNQLAAIYKDLLPGPARDQLCRFIFGLCARAVLNIKWAQLDKDDTIKKNLCATVENVNEILSLQGFDRFQLIQELMESHWTHPVLSKIMSGDDEDTEDCLEYIQKEDPEVLKLRIEIMIKENCEEFALNLCTWSLKHKALDNDLKIKECQIYILYKQGEYGKMQEVCETIVCHDGIKVMAHLAKVPANQELCIRLAQVFLIQAWIKPKKSCCTQELLKLWIHHQYLADKDEERFLDSIWMVAKVCRDTEQIGVLIDGVQKECGDMFVQMYTELCKYAVNIDKGNIEMAQSIGNEVEVKIRKLAMSKTCVRMAFMLKDFDFRIARVCGLTAFALDPNMDNLNLVNKLYWTIKNTSAISVNSKINIATLYEIERLLNQIRPDVLNPEYSWKQLIPLCKKYKQECENGTFGKNYVNSLSASVMPQVSTATVSDVKTNTGEKQKIVKPKRIRQNTTKCSQPVRRTQASDSIHQEHIAKLLSEKNLTRDQIDQILSQQFPRNILNSANAPSLTMKELDKTIDDLKRSIYLETDFRQTLQKNLSPLEKSIRSSASSDNLNNQSQTSGFQHDGALMLNRQQNMPVAHAAGFGSEQLQQQLGVNTICGRPSAHTHHGFASSPMAAISSAPPPGHTSVNQIASPTGFSAKPHTAGKKSVTTNPTVVIHRISSSASTSHNTLCLSQSCSQPAVLNSVSAQLCNKNRGEMMELKTVVTSTLQCSNIPHSVNTSTQQYNILHPAGTSEQKHAKIAQQIAVLHECHRAAKEKLEKAHTQNHLESTQIILNTKNIQSGSQISDKPGSSFQGSKSDKIMDRSYTTSNLSSHNPGQISSVLSNTATNIPATVTSMQQMQGVSSTRQSSKHIQENAFLSKMIGTSSDTSNKAGERKPFHKGLIKQKYVITTDKTIVPKLKFDSFGNVNVAESPIHVQPLVSVVVPRSLTNHDRVEELKKTISKMVSKLAKVRMHSNTVTTLSSQVPLSVPAMIPAQQPLGSFTTSHHVSTNSSLPLENHLLPSVIHSELISSVSAPSPAAINTAQPVMSNHQNTDALLKIIARTPQSQPNISATDVVTGVSPGLLQNLNTLASASVSVRNQVNSSPLPAFHQQQSLHQFIGATKVDIAPAFTGMQHIQSHPSGPILTTPLSSVSQSSVGQSMSPQQLSNLNSLVHEMVVQPVVTVQNSISSGNTQMFINVQQLENSEFNGNFNSFGTGALPVPGSTGNIQNMAPELSPAILKQIVSSSGHTSGCTKSSAKQTAVGKPVEISSCSNKFAENSANRKSNYVELAAAGQDIKLGSVDSILTKNVDKAAQKIRELQMKYGHLSVPVKSLQALPSAVSSLQITVSESNNRLIPKLTNKEMVQTLVSVPQNIQNYFSHLVYQQSFETLNQSIPELPDLGAKEFQIDQILALDTDSFGNTNTSMPWPNEVSGLPASPRKNSTTDTTMVSHSKSHLEEVLQVVSEQDLLSHFTELCNANGKRQHKKKSSIQSAKGSNESVHVLEQKNVCQSANVNANMTAKGREVNSKNLENTDEKNISVQQRKNPKKKIVKCEVCSVYFRTNEQLATHIHSGNCILNPKQPPLTAPVNSSVLAACQNCCLSFNNPKLLNDHIKNYCLKNPDSVWKCPKCYCYFQNSEQVRNHLKMATCVNHGENQSSGQLEKIQCGICEKLFKSMNEIKEHVKRGCFRSSGHSRTISDAIKDCDFCLMYKCSNCNFINSNERISVKHFESCSVNIKTGLTKAELITMYRCNMCGEVFNDMEVMSRHILKQCPKRKITESQKQVQEVYQKLRMTNKLQQSATDTSNSMSKIVTPSTILDGKSIVASKMAQASLKATDINKCLHHQMQTEVETMKDCFVRMVDDIKIVSKTEIENKHFDMNKVKKNEDSTGKAVGSNPPVKPCLTSIKHIQNVENKAGLESSSVKVIMPENGEIVMKDTVITVQVPNKVLSKNDKVLNECQKTDVSSKNKEKELETYRNIQREKRLSEKFYWEEFRAMEKRKQELKEMENKEKKEREKTAGEKQKCNSYSMENVVDFDNGQELKQITININSTDADELYLDKQVGVSAKWKETDGQKNQKHTKKIINVNDVMINMERNKKETELNSMIECCNKQFENTNENSMNDKKNDEDKSDVTSVKLKSHKLHKRKKIAEKRSRLSTSKTKFKNNDIESWRSERKDSDQIGIKISIKAHTPQDIRKLKCLRAKRLLKMQKFLSDEMAPIHLAQKKTEKIKNTLHSNQEINADLKKMFYCKCCDYVSKNVCSGYAGNIFHYIQSHNLGYKVVRLKYTCKFCSYSVPASKTMDVKHHVYREHKKEIMQQIIKSKFDTVLSTKKSSTKKSEFMKKLTENRKSVKRQMSSLLSPLKLKQERLKKHLKAEALRRVCAERLKVIAHEKSCLEHESINYDLFESDNTGAENKAVLNVEQTEQESKALNSQELVHGKITALKDIKALEEANASSDRQIGRLSRKDIILRNNKIGMMNEDIEAQSSTNKIVSRSRTSSINSMSNVPSTHINPLCSVKTRKRNSAVDKAEVIHTRNGRNIRKSDTESIFNADSSIKICDDSNEKMKQTAEKTQCNWSFLRRKRSITSRNQKSEVANITACEVPVKKARSVTKPTMPNKSDWHENLESVESSSHEIFSKKTRSASTRKTTKIKDNSLRETGGRTDNKLAKSKNSVFRRKGCIRDNMNNSVELDICPIYNQESGSDAQGYIEVERKILQKHSSKSDCKQAELSEDETIMLNQEGGKIIGCKNILPANKNLSIKVDIDQATDKMARRISCGQCELVSSEQKNEMKTVLIGPDDDEFSGFHAIPVIKRQDSSNLVSSENVESKYESIQRSKIECIKSTPMVSLKQIPNAVMDVDEFAFLKDSTYLKTQEKGLCKDIVSATALEIRQEADIGDVLKESVLNSSVVAKKKPASDHIQETDDHDGNLEKMSSDFPPEVNFALAFKKFASDSDNVVNQEKGKVVNQETKTKEENIQKGFLGAFAEFASQAINAPANETQSKIPKVSLQKLSLKCINKFKKRKQLVKTSATTKTNPQKTKKNEQLYRLRNCSVNLTLLTQDEIDKLSGKKGSIEKKIDEQDVILIEDSDEEMCVMSNKIFKENLQTDLLKRDNRVNQRKKSTKIKSVKEADKTLTRDIIIPNSLIAQMLAEETSDGADSNINNTDGGCIEIVVDSNSCLSDGMVAVDVYCDTSAENDLNEVVHSNNVIIIVDEDDIPNECSINEPVHVVNKSQDDCMDCEVLGTVNNLQQKSLKQDSQKLRSSDETGHILEKPSSPPNGLEKSFELEDFSKLSTGISLTHITDEMAFSTSNETTYNVHMLAGHESNQQSEDGIKKYETYLKTDHLKDSKVSDCKNQNMEYISNDDVDDVLKKVVNKEIECSEICNVTASGDDVCYSAEDNTIAGISKGISNDLKPKIVEDYEKLIDCATLDGGKTGESLLGTLLPIIDIGKEPLTTVESPSLQKNHLCTGLNNVSPDKDLESVSFVSSDQLNDIFKEMVMELNKIQDISNKMSVLESFQEIPTENLELNESEEISNKISISESSQEIPTETIKLNKSEDISNKMCMAESCQEIPTENLELNNIEDISSKMFFSESCQEIPTENIELHASEDIYNEKISYKMYISESPQEMPTENIELNESDDISNKMSITDTLHIKLIGVEIREAIEVSEASLETTAPIESSELSHQETDKVIDISSVVCLQSTQSNDHEYITKGERDAHDEEKMNSLSPHIKQVLAEPLQGNIYQLMLLDKVLTNSAEKETANELLLSNEFDSIDPNVTAAVELKDNENIDKEVEHCQKTELMSESQHISFAEIKGDDTANEMTESQCISGAEINDDTSNEMTESHCISEAEITGDTTNEISESQCISVVDIEVDTCNEMSELHASFEEIKDDTNNEMSDSHGISVEEIKGDYASNGMSESQYISEEEIKKGTSNEISECIAVAEIKDNDTSNEMSESQCISAEESKGDDMSNEMSESQYISLAEIKDDTSNEMSESQCISKEEIKGDDTSNEMTESHSMSVEEINDTEINEISESLCISIVGIKDDASNEMSESQCILGAEIKGSDASDEMSESQCISKEEIKGDDTSNEMIESQYISKAEIKDEATSNEILESQCISEVEINIDTSNEMLEAQYISKAETIKDDICNKMSESQCIAFEEIKDDAVNEVLQSSSFGCRAGDCNLCTSSKTRCGSEAEIKDDIANEMLKSLSISLEEINDDTSNEMSESHSISAGEIKSDDTSNEISESQCISEAEIKDDTANEMSESQYISLAEIKDDAVNELPSSLSFGCGAGDSNLPPSSESQCISEAEIIDDACNEMLESQSISVEEIKDDTSNEISESRYISETEIKDDATNELPESPSFGCGACNHSLPPSSESQCISEANIKDDISNKMSDSQSISPEEISDDTSKKMLQSQCISLVEIKDNDTSNEMTESQSISVADIKADTGNKMCEAELKESGDGKPTKTEKGMSANLSASDNQLKENNLDVHVEQDNNKDAQHKSKNQLLALTATVMIPNLIIPSLPKSIPFTQEPVKQSFCRSLSEISLSSEPALSLIFESYVDEHEERELCCHSDKNGIDKVDENIARINEKYFLNHMHEETMTVDNRKMPDEVKSQYVVTEHVGEGAIVDSSSSLKRTSIENDSNVDAESVLWSHENHSTVLVMNSSILDKDFTGLYPNSNVGKQANKQFTADINNKPLTENIKKETVATSIDDVLEHLEQTQNECHKNIIAKISTEFITGIEKIPPIEREIRNTEHDCFKVSVNKMASVEHGGFGNSSTPLEDNIDNSIATNPLPNDSAEQDIVIGEAGQISSLNEEKCTYKSVMLDNPDSNTPAVALTQTHLQESNENNCSNVGLCVDKMDDVYQSRELHEQTSKDFNIKDIVVDINAKNLIKETEKNVIEIKKMDERNVSLTCTNESLIETSHTGHTFGNTLLQNDMNKLEKSPESGDCNSLAMSDFDNFREIKTESFTKDFLSESHYLDEGILGEVKQSSKLSETPKKECANVQTVIDSQTVAENSMPLVISTEACLKRKQLLPESASSVCKKHKSDLLFPETVIEIKTKSADISSENMELTEVKGRVQSPVPVIKISSGLGYNKDFTKTDEIFKDKATTQLEVKFNVYKDTIKDKVNISNVPKEQKDVMSPEVQLENESDENFRTVLLTSLRKKASGQSYESDFNFEDNRSTTLNQDESVLQSELENNLSNNFDTASLYSSSSNGSNSNKSDGRAIRKARFVRNMEIEAAGCKSQSVALATVLLPTPSSAHKNSVKLVKNQRQSCSEAHILSLHFLTSESVKKQTRQASPARISPLSIKPSPPKILHKSAMQGKIEKTGVKQIMTDTDNLQDIVKTVADLGKTSYSVAEVEQITALVKKDGNAENSFSNVKSLRSLARDFKPFKSEVNPVWGTRSRGRACMDKEKTEQNAEKCLLEIETELSAGNRLQSCSRSGSKDNSDISNKIGSPQALNTRVKKITTSPKSPNIHMIINESPQNTIVERDILKINRLRSQSKSANKDEVSISDEKSLAYVDSEYMDGEGERLRTLSKRGSKDAPVAYCSKRGPKTEIKHIESPCTKFKNKSISKNLEKQVLQRRRGETPQGDVKIPKHEVQDKETSVVTYVVNKRDHIKSEKDQTRRQVCKLVFKSKTFVQYECAGNCNCNEEPPVKILKLDGTSKSPDKSDSEDYSHEFVKIDCDHCITNKRSYRTKRKPYQPSVRKVIHDGRVFEIGDGKVTERDLNNMVQKHENCMLSGSDIASNIHTRLRSKVVQKDKATHHSSHSADLLEANVKMKRNVFEPGTRDINSYIAATLNEIKKRKDRTKMCTSAQQTVQREKAKLKTFPYAFKYKRR